MAVEAAQEYDSKKCSVWRGYVLERLRKESRQDKEGNPEEFWQRSFLHLCPLQTQFYQPRQMLGSMHKQNRLRCSVRLSLLQLIHWVTGGPQVAAKQQSWTHCCLQSSRSAWKPHPFCTEVTFWNAESKSEMQTVMLASWWECLGVTSDSQWQAKDVHCTLLVGRGLVICRFENLGNQPFAFMLFHGSNTEWIEGENNFILINNSSSKMLMSHGLQASKCKDFWQNFNLAKI